MPGVAPASQSVTPPAAVASSGISARGSGRWATGATSGSASGGVPALAACVGRTWKSVRHSVPPCRSTNCEKALPANRVFLMQETGSSHAGRLCTSSCTTWVPSQIPSKWNWPSASVLV